MEGSLLVTRIKRESTNYGNLMHDWPYGGYRIAVEALKEGSPTDFVLKPLE